MFRKKLALILLYLAVILGYFCTFVYYLYKVEKQKEFLPNKGNNSIIKQLNN